MKTNKNSTSIVFVFSVWTILLILAAKNAYDAGETFFFNFKKLEEVVRGNR